eukprot:CAMPEP_0113708686 /NCGR_PEP_ID=MMETSP0038_2-20120614/29131_1 /TAXON_ID=2898 /ORGANISM="Cryptomonas paramecium" /LENGTH=85 /DNA_ID=CAMNT_0000634443 /DNA_START=65 /DNA_END=317 /DNA_ORIENTATION=+ /assembly_acc=CAM_ASM_000170
MSRHRSQPGGVSSPVPNIDTSGITSTIALTPGRVVLSTAPYHPFIKRTKSSLDMPVERRKYSSASTPVAATILRASRMSDALSGR